MYIPAPPRYPASELRLAPAAAPRPASGHSLPAPPHLLAATATAALFRRQSSTSNGSSPSQDANVTIGVVVGVVLGVFLIGVFAFLWVYRSSVKFSNRKHRRRKSAGSKSSKSSKSSTSSSDAGPPPPPAAAPAPPPPPAEPAAE